MSYVKLVGTKNRHEGWSSTVLVGDPDDPKSVVRGVPVDLTDEEQDKLEELGFVFEDSSEDELHEQEDTDQSFVAVEGTAPMLGPDSGQADQVKEALAQAEDTARVNADGVMVDQAPAPLIDPQQANPQGNVVESSWDQYDDENDNDSSEGVSE